jgi:hypothetical protein
VDLRDHRRRELHRLRESDPAQLIAMYRQLTALAEDRPLPLGSTFVSIVEAVLDDEFSKQPSSDESL